jgi:hypothetical protein
MQHVQKPWHELHGIRLHTNSESLLTGYHHWLQKLVRTNLPSPTHERMSVGTYLQDVQENKMRLTSARLHRFYCWLRHMLCTLNHSHNSKGRCRYWLTPTLITYEKLATDKERGWAQSNAQKGPQLSYTDWWTNEHTWPLKFFVCQIFFVNSPNRCTRSDLHVL